MFSVYGEGFGCTDPIKAPVPQECVCPSAQWGGLAGAARGGGARPLGTRGCAAAARGTGPAVPADLLFCGAALGPADSCL